MHAHEAVLSAGRVASACWVYGDGVDRTEMALDTADFLLEDLVPKAGFEFTLAERGGGNAHGVLSTAEEDVWSLGVEGCAVQRCFGCVGLDDHEGFCVVYLRGEFMSICCGGG